MDDYVIVKTNIGYLEEKMKQSGIKVLPAYSGKTLLSRIIRKIKDKFNISIMDYPYNKNIKNLSQNTIIVFDSSITLSYLYWLSKHNRNKRIIFWYWNPVNQSININKFKNIEKWSYSMEDCLKFNMNYNTTFYFSSNEKIKSCNLKYDIYFMGRDKDRLDTLLKYEKIFNKFDLTTLFYVVPDSWHKIRNKTNYKKEITYKQNISMIAQSRAILDYYTNVDTGISLRPMEALFFKKKLITNHAHIKEYDFYNNNNIFILGEDNLDKLYEFIYAPYKELDLEIKNKYIFTEWIKRFS